jgi:hypothetical protein
MRSIATGLPEEAAMKSAISLATIIIALPLLGACDRPPQPPDKTTPPEPQVQASLHGAMRVPVDRTKQAQMRINETARQRRMATGAAAG